MSIRPLLLLSLVFIGCGRTTDSANKKLDEIALERVEEAVMQSLIDTENAKVTNVNIEFKGDYLVVVSCQVTAKNSLGGMVRNIFEYIYTKDGNERVENVSAGNTTYSGARALAADSIYTKSYNSIVEKNILTLMK